MNTIVIETALTIEQEAVVERLYNVCDYEHPSTKTIYKVGNYTSNGKKLEIVVGRTNQTNINAGIETERIIQHFNPTYLFFLGVAGGLKDVKIGDVVVGTDVIGYERGKVNEQFLLRPQFGFASYEMEQKASSFYLSRQWQEIAKILVENKFGDKISVFTGTIASGEKVIASADSEIYKFLKTNCSHALAVEMEGLGFLEACRPYPLVKTLIVRGISDLADSNKLLADREGSQPYASNNATSFLFGLIDYLGIKQELVTLTLRQKLVEISPKLYPAGVRDNAVWERAGGDLSVVNLYTNGKTQWHESLFLIEKGGGGNIDFQKLITEMKSDYPNNESLKNL